MITYTANNSLQDYKYTQTAFLPHNLLVPLSQDSGHTCKSLVKSGDRVSEGQIIARADDDLDITIHSPLPGTILDVEACVSPNGKLEHAIRIEMEGKFSYLGKKLEAADWQKMSSSEIIRKIREKSLVNTFKINEPVNLACQIEKAKKAQALIVRLFDEDPTRITDSLVFKFYFDQIVTGSQILAKAMGFNKIVFAINKDLKNKDEYLSKELSDIHFLEMGIVRYPCGTPREICSAFSRNLKKTKDFVITKNDLFIDSSTAYDIYKAVVMDIPSMSKLVHFSGNCLYASCLLEVKIGTTFRDIVNQLGGFAKKPALVIVNGALSGVSVSDLDVPVTKYVKSVTFNSSKSFTDEHIYSCINCGDCRAACPVHISPDIIYNNAVNFKELPEQIEKSTFACIDCGRCNTVCPARLPLCQSISVVKQRLINKNKEEKQ